jgi:hypothetical protein
MKYQLTFEAACGERLLGIVTVSCGVAAARVGAASVRGVPLGQALLWVREHNPYPDDVHFRLMNADTPAEILWCRQ